MDLAAQCAELESVPLLYSIDSSTPQSGRYVVENILVDNPTDQGSRWSTSMQHNSTQWITLRLDSVSIVKSITFGKFHKSHPCNMKDFKVYLGLTSERLVEVLHASLKNDNIPENFALRYLDDNGLCIPTLYVKIVPLSAHGASFNSSIWYISMTGIADETVIERVKRTYDEFQETHALRYLLKHLRQRRLLSEYHSILERSGIEFEHPLVSQLHSAIVLQGDWERAELLLTELSNARLYEKHLHSSQSQAVWKRLLHPSGNETPIPSPRGAHAMCIDHQRSLIYLFGGYDGKKSLDDFWVYDISTGTWRILSEHVGLLHNGPGPRSLHKMVFDTQSNSVFVFGKLPEPDKQKTKQNGSADKSSASTSRMIPSDFYRYDVTSDTWEHLTDPETVGGPSTLFDHQMVIDVDRQMIYVSGGRLGDGDWQTNSKCSGMYSYSLKEKKWSLLQLAESGGQSSVVIPPRFGHSMVLDPTTQTLFIFSGQCGDKFLSDLYTYDIENNTAREVSTNFTMSGGPEPSFTQRAVINTQAKEIYIFTGLTRSVATGQTTILTPNSPSWIYRYNERPGKWIQVLHRSSPGEDEIPVSRFAQEVVFDPTSLKVYVHGGNAGVVSPLEKVVDREKKDKDKVSGEEMKRLDDFWEMTLQRSSSEEVIRRTTFLLRQQQFKEMCEESSAVRALTFLQTEVASVVNHSDPKEAESFRVLLTHLLSSQPFPSSPIVPQHEVPERPEETLPPRKRSRPNTPEESPTRSSKVEIHVQSEPPPRNVAERMLEKRDPMEPPGSALSEHRFRQRNEVFEQILQFVGDEAKQPADSLLDMFGVNLAPS